MSTESANSFDPIPLVTPDERAAYERDGVVCLRSRVPLRWLEELREAVEVAMREPGPHAEEYTPDGRPGRYFGDLDLAERHAAFRRFVLMGPAAALAGELMGSAKVNFFYDQLLVKEPGTAERTPWHQDQPYWAVSGRDVCSLWLPLDPVRRASSLEYVAGSHRWNQAYNPQHFKDGSPYRDTGLPALPDIEAERERLNIVGWDLEPGDCLVFQAMIVHGSGGNASLSQRRRAYSTRWTGDDARFLRRGGEIAIPTRDPGLAHGASMDCAQFPVVWRRGRDSGTLATPVTS